MPVADFEIQGTRIEPGQTKTISLLVSEFYTSSPTEIPVFVRRGHKTGPRLFVTAAMHGDEINGVQTVRNVILELREKEIRGTVVLVPVVNRFGFMHHTRELPDNRDLNRSFPGSPVGSLASRYAWTIFREIVAKCTHGIDLHTAGAGRTNMPQVRCDMKDPRCRRMAKAFGTNLILHHDGQEGTLRAAATQAGIPTILYEAGETFKFERDLVADGKRGVLGVMAELGMIDYQVPQPDFRVTAKKDHWVRCSRGGLLDVYPKPGDLVYEGDVLAVVTNPFGDEVEVVRAPFAGLVIGRVTLPLANPGSPIAHMVKLTKSLSRVQAALEARFLRDPVQRAREALRTGGDGGQAPAKPVAATARASRKGRVGGPQRPTQ